MQLCDVLAVRCHALSLSHVTRVRHTAICGPVSKHWPRAKTCVGRAASASGVERLWSHAGLVITPQCNRLFTSTADRLLFVKLNFLLQDTGYAKAERKQFAAWLHGEWEGGDDSDTDSHASDDGDEEACRDDDDKDARQRKRSRTEKSEAQ